MSTETLVNDSTSLDDLIWTPEQLLGFLSHASTEVRKWAVERLNLVDPAAARDAAPALLADAEWPVCEAAIGVMQAHPDAPAEPRGGALEAFLRRDAVPEPARRRAETLLFRAQEPDEAAVRRRFEALHASNRILEAADLAACHPAVCRPELMRWLREGDLELADGPAEVLLPVLAEPENVPLLMDRLRAFDDEYARREAAKAILGTAGAEDLLFEREEEEEEDDDDDDDAADVRSFIEERCDAAGVDAASALPTRCCEPVRDALSAGHWARAVREALERFPEIPASDAFAGRDRMGLAILRALAAEEDPGELHARMALAVLLDRSCRGLMLGAVASGDAEAMVRLLAFSAEAETRLLTGAVVRMWNDAQDRAELTGVVMDALGPEQPDDQRDEALLLCTELPGFPLERALERAIQGEPSQDLVQDVADVAARIPALLRELARGHLGDAHEATAVALLEALGRTPHLWATALVLEHLDALLDRGLADEVWPVLRMLGDPAALDAVLRQWRPGEPACATVVDFLWQLSGRTDALPPGVHDDVSRARSLAEVAVELASSSGTEELCDRVLGRPLDLSLRCNRCGRVFYYEVERAIVARLMNLKEPLVQDDWDQVVLSRIITCKQCGAEDDYTLTPHSKLLVTAGLMVRMMRRDESDTENLSIQLGAPRLWDGSIMQRPTQGLLRLRELAEARPDGGEAWRRLGNLARLYHRPEEAIAAFRRAIEVDETEAEAASTLAAMLREEGSAEAFAFVGTALERLPRSSSDGPMRRIIAEEVLAILRDALAGSPNRLAILVAWDAGMVRRQPVLRVSSMDLRRVRDWDVLVEFLAGKEVMSIGLTTELPEDVPSQLEEHLSHLASRAQHAEELPALGAGLPVRPVVRDQPKTGRNDPCPCGSGKKYKKCCGKRS